MQTAKVWLKTLEIQNDVGFLCIYEVKLKERVRLGEELISWGWRPGRSFVSSGAHFPVWQIWLAAVLPQWASSWMTGGCRRYFIGHVICACILKFRAFYISVGLIIGVFISILQLFVLLYLSLKSRNLTKSVFRVKFSWSMLKLCWLIFHIG